MVLELGPCPATDVLAWSKFARRIIVELRACPDQGLVSSDLIALWATTLDRWSAEATKAAETPDRPFRWVEEMEPEVAEFLLDGLDRCLHSSKVMSWVTQEEAVRQRAFTGLVVRAFLGGLAAEGHGCLHFADHINQSLSPLLVD